MKKLYLIACAAMLGLTAQAREFTFFMGNTPVTPGTTVTFEKIEITDEGGYFSVMMDPDLYVSSDIFTNTAVIKATCTSGQGINLCAGGSCSSGTTVTKENVTISTNQKVPLKYDFIGEYDTVEEIPTVISEIEATDAKYPEVKASFTIVMGRNAGVTVIENSPELRFNGSALEYDLAAPATLALFNATGTQVLSAQLEGRGTLSTTDLEAGIYVYSLNGKTNKIYIR